MTPTILFILHLPPPVHGAAMVGKYIHDSELINSRFDCHYINLTTAKSLQDIGKGGVKKLWRYLNLLRQIRQDVKRLKPQLVYVTPNACGGAFYKDFVVVQILKRMGCRVVVHYHNKGVATRQDRWLDDWLYRRFFPGLKVILLAEALYQDVKKYVKREDVYICPNGIPETLDHEPQAARHNRIPHLLFLSNLLVDKGVLVLLDALKILKDKGYSFVCDFVGGETAEIDAARFQREVEERGLNRLVVYDGRKYGKDKAEFFEKADAFVFPSCNEAFGLVSLEAMEHKLPVVATDEGGIPDVVKDGENGLIAEKHNAQSLADCVAKLMDDDTLRKKMGEDGYRKFKAKFTLRAFEAKMADVVGEISESGGVILDFVYYYGKKYGLDKHLFFRQADVFVAPSLNEAFPLVNLEAMEYALPVVATDTGGVTAEVKDGLNGLIAEKGNAQSLAQCLMKLMDYPDVRERMGEEGYRLFKAHFTLDVFESRLSECLDKIVNSGGGNL